MTISEKIGAAETLEEKIAIDQKLRALEIGEEPARDADYRADVRGYSSYLVPFVRTEHGVERLFKIAGLYGVDSIPVFLSEDVYRLFQDDYLKKHGQLDDIVRRRETLTLKTFSGRELFETLPPASLGSVFILSAGDSELLFNFNLAEVFRDCFHEIWTDPDLRFDPPPPSAAEAENGSPCAAAVQKSARGKIERDKIFRGLFENPEWIVLISLVTKNKLLKGEFSRDDFALDRYGDGRILIFSDAAAVDEYRKATGQTPEKLYNIKIDRRRLFGADLSSYEGLAVDPYSPHAMLVGKAHFERLNELFAAFEIEEQLLEIAAARQNSVNYSELTDYYIGLKEFKGFILPIDKRSENRGERRIAEIFAGEQDASGGDSFPVFTAEDCFEAFRLDRLEETNPAAENFIEPYFIDGPTLFREMSARKARRMIFNPQGPARPLAFEPNFALKVYCA